AELHIKARLTDVRDTIVLACTELGKGSMEKIADIVTKDGMFEYRLKTDKPKTLVLFRPYAQQRGQMMIYNLPLPAVPGETVEISGTVMQPTIGGSAFYKDYATVMDFVKTFNKSMLEAADAYNAAAKDSLQREKAGEDYATNMATASKLLIDQLFGYARQNPDSEISAYLASFIQTEYIEDYLKLLSPKAKESRMKPAVEAAVSRLEAERKMKEAEANVAEGKPAPDFTLNDIHGKPFSLSSLRGKYVVLDFWGSWCGWCIKGMPEMKRYYAKYSGKFEIVGIDCNDTERKWKEAVEKNALLWINVKSEQEDATPERYAVKGFPTKVVVAPDGTIAKIAVGESPEFYKYLDSLFGEE
ncbi:MAG: TlpA disulfide reductase family protein, partial [Bacteroidales bacterium]|nr:TlpA disulfide reductase family protein [Bacteroidales bacterium]